MKNVSPVMSELYVFSKNDNIAHMNRKGAKTLVHYIHAKISNVTCYWRICYASGTYRLFGEFLQ